MATDTKTSGDAVPIDPGSNMVPSSWGTPDPSVLALMEQIQSGSILINRIQEMHDTLLKYVPSPDSIRHPDTAIESVDKQLAWLASSYQRAMLDHNDALRRHMLITLKTCGLSQQKVTFPDVVKKGSGRGSSSEVSMVTMTVEEMVHAVFNEVRRTYLTQANVYGKGIQYFARLWLSGGTIPEFPYLDEPVRDPAPAHPSTFISPTSGL